MASEDGFDYFVKESNFFNLKTYYESLITADEFDKNKIDSISCPYKRYLIIVQFSSMRAKHNKTTQKLNVKCMVVNGKKKLIWLK